MSSNALSCAAVTVAATLATGLPARAAPTLIGDTISFMRAYPAASTQYGPAIPDATVVAGTGDAVGWGGSGINIDPEASSVRFNYNVTTGMVGGASAFDGFVVTGIDAEVDAVSILSNNSYYTVVSLVNTGHGFNISLSSATVFTPPGSLVVGLQLHDPNVPAVPEPAPLLLLALGLPVVLPGRGRNSAARVQDCNTA